MKVLAFGTFDDLHPGHRFVLDAAQKRGDVTVVIARDGTVLKIKGRSPVESSEQRMKRIREAYPNVHVVLGDESDYLAPLRAAQPDLILLGYDQQLPPGVTEADLPCPVERLKAFEPHIHKSSLRRMAK
jgi:FAD synthetase